MHAAILPAGAALLIAACSASGEETGRSRPGSATTATSADPATLPATTATEPATTATEPATTTTSSSSFTAIVEPVDAAALPASWRPGCPVGPDDLRRLVVAHWGFDGTVHTGELVVHADVAGDVVSVLGTLFEARFPIERMERVDVYGGDDDASIRANNTSAFNCREVTGGGRWSEHAYGRAIDVNPLQNPYVYRDGSVLDPASGPFADRTRGDAGMIHDGDVVVRAFAAIGWEWGGYFRSIKDYQHFSQSGR